MDAFITGGVDPVTAVGGAIGIIIGMTHAVRTLFNWRGEQALGFCLCFSLAVAASITLAEHNTLWSHVHRTVGHGLGLFLLATGIYKMGRTALAAYISPTQRIRRQRKG